MLRAFYVDDCLKSVQDEETAILLAKELIKMLKLGGFRLTKFISNHQAVLDALPPSEVSPSFTFQIDTEKLERVLGVSWDAMRDVFKFVFAIKESPTTKRGILSVTFSLFDPMGFLTPFILKPKLLLQELWKLGRDWDEEVDENIARQWKKWMEACKNVSQLEIPRCYVHDLSAISQIQLHLFCDASEVAYGAVAYL